MKKIGLLLPRSTYYNSIGFDLHEGFKQGLLTFDADDVDIISENIGFGTDSQVCYNVAEKLLLSGEVDIIIAYISHKTAQLLRPLFKATNKILLVLDGGANLPQEWPKSSNTIYHSLHNSLGNYMATGMAARQDLVNAATVTGYYDGGYLQYHAGFLGYLNAGGSILYNHSTSYKREDFTLQGLKNWLDAGNSVDCLLSLFSGDFIQWYFEELLERFAPNELTVVLPPFGLEETVLADAPYPVQNICGLASWSRKLKSSENEAFISKMESVGKSPNLFSLLGYEASFLVKPILELMSQSKQNGKEVCKALMELEFQTPRGKLVFDKETQTSISALYEARIIGDMKGMCELEIIGKIGLDRTMEAYRQMVSLPLNNATSGWVNSYTCI